MTNHFNLIQNIPTVKINTKDNLFELSYSSFLRVQASISVIVANFFITVMELFGMIQRCLLFWLKNVLKCSCNSFNKN